MASNSGSSSSEHRAASERERLYECCYHECVHIDWQKCWHASHPKRVLPPVLLSARSMTCQFNSHLSCAQHCQCLQIDSGWCCTAPSSSSSRWWLAWLGSVVSTSRYYMVWSQSQNAFRNCFGFIEQNGWTNGFIPSDVYVGGFYCCIWGRLKCFSVIFMLKHCRNYIDAEKYANFFTCHISFGIVYSIAEQLMFYITFNKFTKHFEKTAPIERKKEEPHSYDYRWSGPVEHRKQIIHSHCRIHALIYHLSPIIPFRYSPLCNIGYRLSNIHWSSALPKSLASHIIPYGICHTHAIQFPSIYNNTPIQSYTSRYSASFALPSLSLSTIPKPMPISHTHNTHINFQ